jgi:RNase H-like domain found in reverse transcriptase
MERPFAIHVDVSDYAAGGILTQTMEDGSEKPVAFASEKFSTTQKTGLL